MRPLFIMLMLSAFVSCAEPADQTPAPALQKMESSVVYFRSLVHVEALHDDGIRYPREVKHIRPVHQFEFGDKTVTLNFQLLRSADGVTIRSNISETFVPWSNVSCIRVTTAALEYDKETNSWSIVDESVE